MKPVLADIVTPRVTGDMEPPSFADGIVTPGVMNDNTVTPGITSDKDALETKALLSSLSEFSARAGHDLVGPLNQAGSLLALFIRRYRDQLDSEADQLLGFLQSAASKMEGAVAGVSEFMATAASPPNLTRIDLGAALGSALISFQKEISRTGATIEAESMTDATADGPQITALFQILISNSLKFRKPDTAPKIHVSCRPGREFLTITVTDNGTGIDPKLADLVFQPFRRLHGREYPGAGLGLALAKLIIERHGGTVQVAECETGACLQFTLPSAD